MKQQQSSAQKGNPAINVQQVKNFSKKDLFVGIDVHKERWQVAVYYEGLVRRNTVLKAPALHMFNTCANAMVKRTLAVIMIVVLLAFRFVTHCKTDTSNSFHHTISCL